MKLSANQAAKEIGKSVPTITRAIKRGALTAEKRKEGGYLIDPAELFRVWPRVTPKDDTQGDTLNDTRPHDTRVLEVELKAERDMRARLEAEIEDLKGQRDKWQGQAERLLIERSTVEAPQAASRGLWDRLTGRRAGT
jgi:hypothetical protein